MSVALTFRFAKLDSGFRRNDVYKGRLVDVSKVNVGETVA